MKNKLFNTLSLLLIVCFTTTAFIAGCTTGSSSSNFPVPSPAPSATIAPSPTPSPLPSPTPQGTVSGIVTNSITDDPLAGVEVALTDKGRAAMTTQTDANGAYTFNDVSAGEHTVDATMTGCHAYSGTINVTQGQQATYNFQMIPYDRVTATDPNDGAVDVPVNQVIIVDFENNIAQGADFAGITVNDGAVNIATTNTVAGNSLTITPDANLDYLATYTVTIPAAAVDGVRSMEQYFTFSFTTEELKSNVTATDPLNGATDVSISKTVTVDFDIDVADGADIGNITVSDGVNPPVAITTDTTTTPNRLIIDPDSRLRPAATYTVTVPVNAVDPPLSSELTFNFTTADNFFEDFEADNGGFTVSGGVWQWGTPTSGPGSAYSGTRCWATILNGNYPDNADANLISPDIDLSGFAGSGTIEVSWYQFFCLEDFWDRGIVYVSNDGGSTWSEQASWTGYLDSSWTQRTITIPDTYAVSNFRIRFRLDTDGSVTDPGWYIDDLYIQPTP